MSKFLAPLSIEQIKEIRQRRDSADMRAVLWDIRCLRAIASTADGLDQSLGERVGLPSLFEPRFECSLMVANV